MDGVLATVARLEALVAEQRATIAEQRATIAELKARVATLEEKLRLSSQNSSKPPSSDGPAAPQRPKKGPSSRKAGAQPGHTKHERELVPASDVNKMVEIRPKKCDDCGNSLTGSDPAPRRHQVFELPKVKPFVTEYRIHSLRCACGKNTCGTLPPGVPSGAFGPSVVALVATLIGVYRLSKRAVPELLHDVFGLTISDGAVIGCQEIASAALKPAHAEAAAFIAKAPVKHADETSWRQARSRAWLWVAVTTNMSLFVVHARRSAVAALALLGAPKGLLVTDRHGAYNAWPDDLHQFCWAHLLRDFRKIAERGGDSERIGNGLIAEAERMFAWWHFLRMGELDRAAFRALMGEVEEKVEELLVEGGGVSHSKTSGTCKQLLKRTNCLWTFVRHENVEPTNNVAERAIRHAVIIRKTSFGTHSEVGSRFIERMLTVHASLRLQKRNVLQFVHTACTAMLSGSVPPSLLPAEPAPASCDVPAAA